MEMFFGIIILSILPVLGLFVFIAKLLNSKRVTQTEQPLPYRAKRYFFTRSEQEFLRCLNENIDRGRYLIFPKVRLADFVEVTAYGVESRSWFNRIRAKHVDYLVWDIEKNSIAFAIELDGSSHNSEKVIERDAFVERLYSTIGLKLERVRTGTIFVDEIKRIFK